VLVKLEVRAPCHFSFLLFLSRGSGPALNLRLFVVEALEGVLVVRLQVESDHIQQHEATNASITGLIKIAALFQEDLEDEVERSQLGEVDLHR